METILVTLIVGLSVLVASSMVYLLVWNLFRVYFTKYMDRYFEYSKDTVITMVGVINGLSENIKTIYMETIKNED